MVATQLDQAVSTFVSLLLLVCLSGCDSSVTSREEPPQTGAVLPIAEQRDFRVLFLGNSHTARHNVPGMVSKIVEAMGHSFSFKYCDGSFIESMSNDPSILDQISSGKWNVAVLQGQKISMSGKYIYSTKEAESLSALIHEHEARVIWYSEWGREGIEGETERIEKIYGGIAKVNDDEIAEVGKVWQRAMSRRDDLKLFSVDGNHASKTGAFLSALALAVAITQEDCRDLPYLNLDEFNIRDGDQELQAFFRTVVSEHFAIKRVLDADSDLGALRNHNCEERSLTETVKAYVKGMRELSFDGCPDDFRTAFETHILAWEDSIPFFDNHLELRGEMHDLFEQIRSQDGATKNELEAVEKAIWRSWSDVESASR